jgi:hypothetical protein
LVASVDLPMIWPISSNGTANMSCCTNAGRSAGRSEYYEQGQSDRIGKQYVVLRCLVVVLIDDQLGQLIVVRGLGFGLARAQYVNANQPNDGGQPSAEIVDRCGVLAGKPQPSSLYCVLRVRPRSEA